MSDELKEVGGVVTWASTGSATKRLNVYSRTLYEWEKAGRIEGFKTPGGKWRWNVAGFLARQQQILRDPAVWQPETQRADRRGYQAP